jgi:Secretion system C-terminal sorting domain
MKNKIFQLFLILFLYSIYTQLYSQQRTFSRVLYDVDNIGIRAYSAVHTNNGDIVLAGERQGSGLIVKANSIGGTIWNKEFFARNKDSYVGLDFNCVIATSDTGFFVVSDIFNLNLSKRESFYTKLSAEGDTIWTKGITHDEYYVQLINGYQTSDQGFILVGNVQKMTPYEENILIVKLNNIGEIEWSSIYENGESAIRGFSILEMSDQSYIVAANQYDDKSSVVLLNITPNGEILWSKMYYNEENYSGLIGSDLKFIDKEIILYLNSNTGVTIIKTDEKGKLKWTRSYDDNGYLGGIYPKFQVLEDKSMIMVFGGYFGSNFLKVDSLGDILVANNLFLYAFNVFETNNKEYLIIGNGPIEGCVSKRPANEIGMYQIDSIGSEQNCVFQYGMFEQVTTTIITDTCSLTNFYEGTETNIPVIINIPEIVTADRCVDMVGTIDDNEVGEDVNVFPNPTFGKVYIKVSGAREGYVISIFNIQGQKLETVYNKREIDISGFENGIYIISVDNKYYKKIIKN